MAQRVFLHIGPPKTGTSFIQSLCHANRDVLAERGLLYPGENKEAQFQASAVATAKGQVLEAMSDFERRTWNRVTDHVAKWEGDALLSSEHYALGSADVVPAALARLHEVAEEVHLVVTARDLARQLMAMWQQRVKQGSTHTFEKEWTNLSTRENGRFWDSQDLPRLIARWRGDLPADQVHLVVHGPAGSPHDLLWNRFCALLGIEPEMPHTAARANESLGPVEVEFLRRVNLSLPEDHDSLADGRVTKGLFARNLREVTPYGERLLITPEAHAWTRERGARMVEELRRVDLTVHGDLDDLQVGAIPEHGRHPDIVTDEELAVVGVALNARLVQHEVDRRKEAKAMRRENRALRKANEQLESQVAAADEQSGGHRGRRGRQGR